MTNICLKLAYDGAPFCGFARQPGQLTVQGELERALSIIYRDNIQTTCAGRTDSGVHARCQVVNFFLGARDHDDVLIGARDKIDPSRGARDQSRGARDKSAGQNAFHQNGARDPENDANQNCKKASGQQNLTMGSDLAQRYLGPELGSLVRSLNALTHDSISVYDANFASDDFSARFSAKTRTYKYFISNSPPPPIFSKNFSWHISKPLDIEKMRYASSYLIGERDFKSFCLAVSAEGKTTMRNVIAITFEVENFFGEELLAITIRGNAFLHSMVRAIVGSLVLVGKGKREPAWMAEVLAAKDRRAAGENAPAQGLVLWDVEY